MGGLLPAADGASLLAVIARLGAALTAVIARFKQAIQ
jgi:hypothetical protein